MSDATTTLHPHGRVDRRAVGGHRRRDRARTSAGSPSGSSTCCGRSRTSPTASPPTSSPTACRPPRWPSGPAPTRRSSSPRCATTSARPISVPNHPAIAAEILKPYVRARGLRHDPRRTRTSRAGTTTHHFGGDPNAREQYRDALEPELRARRAVRRRVGPGRPSTPTTTRSPSSTSSPWSARSSPPRSPCSSSVAATARYRRRFRACRPGAGPRRRGAGSPSSSCAVSSRIALRRAAAAVLGDRRVERLADHDA